ncbi:transcription elongation factor GreA [Weissella oryzae SG25]|uniref:Transcription elongation factor GreA n=1 Tax=Weissella oryzae (strain DSM 25784 / JCM 18191 / LMG 30913 / SG25) TaxID=1329250 RepID=A0A069CVK0_WEIOS|nr:transcription elongation factor GreA [Weissella oryzae]GAK31412.1 transcription elongation factor GreA [Weissella oryzae SG25]
MAEEKTFPMTLDGKAKIEAELNKLITETRAEITNRIQIARSFGDLSENSEYQSAKDEQAFVEGRINTLQSMLDNSVIIDSSEIAADEVALGKIVTFQELPDEDPETYEIVGAVEADPLAGKISNESPIAQSLIGKTVGDEVTVTLPNNGSMDVKILSVKNA